MQLRTELSADELLNRIRADSLAPSFFRVTGPRYSVVSQITGHKVSIVAAAAISRTHARHFHGEVVNVDGGSLVKGRFRQQPALEIGQYLIAGLFLIVGLLTALRTLDVKPIVITILIVLVGAVINRVKIVRNAPFEEDVQRFLMRVTSSELV